MDFCQLNSRYLKFNPVLEEQAQGLAQAIISQDTGAMQNSLREITALPNDSWFNDKFKRTLKRAENIVDVQACEDSSLPTVAVDFDQVELHCKLPYSGGATYVCGKNTYLHDLKIDYPTNGETPASAVTSLEFMSPYGDQPNTDSEPLMRVTRKNGMVEQLWFMPY